ncbi:hypothetical protein RRG08_067154 [Elysia crispata]|uniref:Uncharacterized protein n=1 Tax=Elysia crispata TaxID=231223 RepID=A0AAE1D2F1_9GAST|nr:hypothetical protein RRG08_067154 [Elysia crispata]
MGNLSSILSPLYKLLQKDVPWQWERDQESAFSAAKRALSSDTLLVHFDPGRIITGDETWVYSWDPETKRQSAEWRDFDEPRPEKVRRKQGALKVMHMIFFDMNGVIVRWHVLQECAARQTQTCHSKETTRAVGVRHLVSPRQCASPYGPGSERRFGWLQVETAGASSLFT